MAKDKKEEKSGTEAEKPEGAEDAKPKSRFAFLFSKKVLMIAAPVLLLAIGGAVYFLMFAGGEEPAAEGAEVADGGDGHGGGHGEKKAAAGDAHHPVFFEVPDILVNVSSQGGKPVFLKLAVSLEIEGATQEEVAQKLEPIMPRIIDQLQTYLRELRLEDLSGSAALFRLKEELLRRINVAAAPVQVKGVLFREMIVQ
ncbi:MAG: flagellar basal body-associated FliL family protein [Alphaproteobacteria bacterium]|jgi:flagellar FliL protein